MANGSKKRAASALDVAMSAFAAGSAAFILYAMPGGAFDEAVQATGLPAFLPAANPPLGMTARLCVMVAGAAASFAAVWLILRALSTPAKQRRPHSKPVELSVEQGLPALRRADAHPDAPSRRPLFAALDLGEPNDEDAEEVCFHHAADEGDLPETEETEAAAEEATQLQEAEFLADAEEVEAETLVESAPVEDLLPEAPAVEASSISELVQRLETGLQRRQAQHGRTPRAVEMPGDEERPEIDDRLRNAIAGLRKFARAD